MPVFTSTAQAAIQAAAAAVIAAATAAGEAVGNFNISVQAPTAMQVGGIYCNAQSAPDANGVTRTEGMNIPLPQLGTAAATPPATPATPIAALAKPVAAPPTPAAAPAEPAATPAA
jgi:hypothetical protein